MELKQIKYVFSVVMLACGSLAPASAVDYTAGSVVVADPWLRAMVPSAKVGAGYSVITNNGDQADRLLAVQSDIADRVEIHTMKMENHVMKMRRLADGLAVAAHETVLLQPGGSHLMFINPHRPFRAGERFSATFVFEKAGRVDVTFDVRPMQDMSGSHRKHGMKGH